MTREIKFRGKAIYDGTFVYGFYVERNGYDYGIIYEPNGLGHDVDPKSVGEFTGLKDKNGVEIYEGDIVRWGNQVEQVREFGHVPFCWTDGISGESLFSPREVEVIGNIYENSELLTSNNHAQTES